MIEPLPNGQHRRTLRRFCSDACKYDYHGLKRAEALLTKVGIIRFHELLDEV